MLLLKNGCRDSEKDGKIKFKKFTAGLDTSYSAKTHDTIAMTFLAITEDRKLIMLAEQVYSNKDLENPLAPSDTAVKFVEFLERCREKWGFAKETYIDCADAATITELRKYKRLQGCLYNFIESYKKAAILDRIKLQLGWITQGCYIVVDTCVEHISNLKGTLGTRKKMCRKTETTTRLTLSSTLGYRTGI